MAKSRAAMMRGVSNAALIVAAIGCGGAQQRPAAEQATAISEPARAEPVGAAPQCVDQKDQPVTCLSDADCCARFVCGRDPELNPRESYCIFGG